jgi:DNA-binding transcriptional ArsR family regulator
VAKQNDLVHGESLNASKQYSIIFKIAAKEGLVAAYLSGAGMAHISINELMQKQEHIETAARALKAISHPLRLKILCVVGDEEICVQDIVEAVGTSQSNISQHLAILRDKGVLHTRKDANRVFYRITDQRTLQLISLMREVFCGEPAHRE